MPTWKRSRLGIGYVPQGRGIFANLSVRENLKFAWSEETGDGSADAGIDRIIADFPRFGAVARPAGRRVERWRTTVAGTRPLPDCRSDSCAAGRTDRRHSTVDHRGNGRNAGCDPRRSGFDLVAGRTEPGISDRAIGPDPCPGTRGRQSRNIARSIRRNRTDRRVRRSGR